MYRKSFLFIVFLLTAQCAFSQQNSGKRKIDSLHAVLKKNAGNLKIQADAHNELGVLYTKMNNTDEAVKNLLAALKIREQLRDEYGIGFTNDLLGMAYFAKAEYPKALDYFQEALKHFEKTKDEYRIALENGNIGLAYSYIGNLYDALVYFKEAEKHYQNIHNTDGKVWMAETSAGIYTQLEKYDKALDIYLELLKLEKNVNKQGDYYMLAGKAYLLLKQYDKGLDFERQAMKIAEKYKNDNLMMQVNYLIGVMYFKRNKIPESLQYLLPAHKTAARLHDVFYLSTLQVWIAKCYYQQGNISEAKKYVKEGLPISQDISNVQDMSEYYLMLSKIDSIEGNTASELKNYKLHIKFDKQGQEENTRKLTQQLEYKERESGILKKQQETERDLKASEKQRNFVIAGLLALSLFTLFLFRLFRLRNKTIKTEKQNLELKQREIELVKETDRFKSRFLANISHEFRTPLTLINGNVEVLKQKSQNEDLKKLDEIDKNGHRLLGLVNQLLDLSKMESGEYKLAYHNGDLWNELQAYISAFDSYAREKQIALKTFVDDGLKQHKYTFSSEALQTIINNLLSNALKYTPEKGEICVKATYGNDLLTLQVSDNGTGIPEEYISKIFDRFFQIEEAYNAVQKGSGIGLSLVKELSRLHGGDVKVFNNAESGCTFEVKILCKAVETEEQPVSETIFEENKNIKENLALPDDNFSATSDEKPLILVVEDQPELRRFIVENIGTNYHCIEAENGKSGAELAQKFVPDLIISDVMMPLMNGLELCKEIKENDITSHIPFILLTAKAELEDKISGLETGADDYILKPFSVAELRLKIRNMLRLQENIRKKFQSAVGISQENIPELSVRDKEFLAKLNAIAEENLTNPDLSVETLTEAVFLSQRQLSRKLKAITGATPADFIRNIRLQKALQFLQNGMNVSETAWAVGFEDASYFGKVFKKHFGVSPTEFEVIFSAL